MTDSITSTILLLDDTDNCEPARQALAAVDDDPQVTALSVSAIGMERRCPACSWRVVARRAKSQF